MQIKSFNTLGVVYAMALFHCHGSAETAIASSDTLTVGQQLSGAVQIGRRQVTLPAGQWELAVKSERNPSTDGSNLNRVQTLSFQELVDGRLHRWLTIEASKYSANVIWQADPCKTKGDSYWIETRHRGLRDELCRRTGFFSNFVDGARGDQFLAWAANLKTRGIGYSSEMPYIQVIRYSSSDYLRMTLQFDPAKQGTALSPKVSRADSFWNGDKVTPGSRQHQFYEALREWAPQFVAAVDRVAAGDDTLMEADYGAPKLP